MPRQSNGQYVAPASTAAVSGQAISSTAFNTLETDIGTEITNSVDRGGRSAMTANLPMGGNKITGLADPTVSTDAGTKNYIDTLVAAFFSTGDGKLTLKNVADSGWILCDDGTIGSATSGSSTRANIDTLALFTLLFNNVSDTYAPIFTSGGSATTRAGQTNAATAWAANCRMSLTKNLGRALAIAGSGSGLTARTLGQTLGEESHVLSQAELPAVQVAINGSVTVTSVNQLLTANQQPSAFTLVNGAGSNLVAFPTGTTAVIASQNSTGSITSGATANLGSGTAHNNMQPSAFWNVMVKL